VVEANPNTQLLERARQGDPRAFELLISPHLPSLRRFAFSFTRDWAEADDLTQEALLKAFRSLSKFEGRSQISTWLYVIVRSAGHDLYRSNRRREQLVGTEDVGDQATLEPNAEEQLAMHADSQELWAAIKQLEPEFRIALVLFEIEGLSYEEIAAIERVPIGTIRSRLSRARASLRSLLLKSGRLTRESGTSLTLRASHVGSTR
jgi:RNA polymerase sigma-70 factor, ECF subfamily